jgi:hypothetical protein
MTRLRTGGAGRPPGGAPRPAGPYAHRPGRPVTAVTVNGIAAGDDGPPGSREAPDRAAWQATARGPVLTVCHVLAPERAAPGDAAAAAVAYVMFDVVLASAGGLGPHPPRPYPIRSPYPTRPRHRREADQAGRWRWPR